MPVDVRKRLLFIVFLALFTFGIFRIFSIRFAAGDIYPPYSSFRSDPLGCRALHDALIHTGDISVSRSVTPLHRMKDLENVTVFVTGLGANDLSGSLPQAWFDAIDALVKQGARLVLCSVPSRFEKKQAAKETPPVKKKPLIKPKKADKGKAGVKAEKTKDKKPAENNDGPKNEGTGENEEPYPVKQVNLSKAWGFEDDYADRAEGTAEPVSNYKSTHGLIAQSWHTSRYFTKLAKAWKPVYTMNGKTVLMERAYGKGSLVFSTDTYFMSNEALRNEANPRLLVFLTGGNRQVIFDEAHFGITSEPGIAGLIKRYELQGFAWVLLLFCLLYIWKNASYFVPPREEDEVRDASARDQASGLASLYKRHIKDNDLLSVCIDEWSKTAVIERRSSLNHQEKQTQIRHTAKGDGGKPVDPVAGYREIKRLLSERDLP